MTKTNFLQEYLDFLQNSPTPYHVVDTCIQKLKQNGYKKCNTNELVTNGKYYLLLHNTLLIAITIPENAKRIKIVATHNDSPVLKLRPNFLKDKKASLQTYGGGLWHTWFDRALCVAGLIVKKDMSTELFCYDKPMFYIPSLAPHLDRSEVYQNGFNYNKEIQLNALCNFDSLEDFYDGRDVLSHDLSLFDFEKPNFLGKNNEFIVSARQDNLLSTFCALKALIDQNTNITDDNTVVIDIKKETNDDISDINIVAIFDYEEIGSLNITGAETNIIKEVVDNLRNLYSISHNECFIVSSDVAHGLNSNYKDKYQEDHAPVLGSGIVVKYSCRYATNCVSSAYIKNLAIKYQEFCLKNTCPGGGTIGPMLCANLGINGVDVGTPILGMHSIKEMSNSDDVYDTYLLFKKFYESKLPFNFHQ